MEALEFVVVFLLLIQLQVLRRRWVARDLIDAARCWLRDQSQRGGNRGAIGIVVEITTILARQWRIGIAFKFSKASPGRSGRVERAADHRRRQPGEWRRSAAHQCE